jgi:alpha-1,3-fucosyltransferase 10
MAKSGRTPYMMQLMKYIDVDNYGTCGNNIRQLPEHIVKIQGSANRILKHIVTYNWEAGKLALSREYLFTIAIENSLTYDYITEKLWHPLIAGSVPIYLGAPNVYDWLPCRTDCIIDLRKFKTPKDSAMFIKTVAKNKTLYESYHQWRNEPVSEKFRNILNYYARVSNYSLECALCEMSHRVGQGEDRKEIKKDLRVSF